MSDSEAGERSDPLALLRVAKAAEQEGLVTHDEYLAIAKAWTKAQMIKAGADAGLLSHHADDAQVRNSFLQSLDFAVQEQQHHAPQPQPLTCTAPPWPQPRPPNGGPLTHAPGGGPLTAAGVAAASLQPRLSNGAHGHVAAAARAPPPPPSPPPPPAAAAFMMSAAAAAASRSGGGAPPAASAPPQSTSGELPGTIPVPTELHRIGRAGVAEGKKSMSGIGLHDSCINLYNHMKTRSSFKFVTYKIDDAGLEVVVDQLGAPDATYEQFLATFPGQQCRYGVYDYAYSNQDTGQVNQKLVFIHWAPSGSSTKSKMMYASTKEFLKGYLEGVGAELQADTVEELDEQELVAKITAGMARK